MIDNATPDIKIKPVSVPRISPDVQPPDLKNLRLAYADDPNEYRKKKAEISPSKNFWQNTAMGRTLSGRNTAGRTIRRVGIGALGVAGSAVGVDLGFLTDAAQPSGDLAMILKTIETIAWIVAGVVLAITKGVDQIEIQGEKYDEREILEGKVPTMRKITSKNRR